MRIKPLLIIAIFLVVVINFSFRAFPLLSSKSIATYLKPTPNRPLASKEAAIDVEKINEAKAFAAKNNFSNRYCFFVNMALPSGTNRFFVYDLKKDSIVKIGLVAHGNCYKLWLEGRKYSNEVGSGCTSLGMYKIGHPYNGRFGRAYKLYGLEASNSNAFERFVVLHSYKDVPDAETTDEICQSNGCPMVSIKFLKELAAIIDNSSKPILLHIYE